MTRAEIFRQVTGAAEPLYGGGESRQLARIVLEELGGVSWSSYILNPETECEIEGLNGVIGDIKRGRPIQYIIGRVEFCGVELTVREGALIPRPESEELVAWVVEQSDLDQRLRVVDLCSGSGALAIALSRRLPNAEVSALELSDEAIEIARENISQCAPGVELIRGDVLDVESYLSGEYDVIISNPPYIPIRERASMHTNVVDYEPAMALFVPNDDPLLFYRSIAISGLKLLRCGGRVYFEIHENFAAQTAEMMTQVGYSEVTIRRDINDKERMVCGVKG